MLLLLLQIPECSAMCSSCAHTAFGIEGCTQDQKPALKSLRNVFRPFHRVPLQQEAEVYAV